MSIKNMTKLKHCLAVSVICLFILSFCIVVGAKKNYYKNVPEQLVIFSEHKSAFSEGHSIKLLNTRSMREVDLKIKTYTYGNFFILNSLEIAWIGDNELYIYNPSTDGLKKINLPDLGIIFEGRELKISDFSVFSISPSGDRIAYLFPKGSRIDVHDNLNSEGTKSLGFRSELHIFDLSTNKDRLITDKAFNWGQPQWSLDGRKLLYARPDNDGCFSQEYINNMSISEKALIKNAIFVYDLDRNIDYKLCQGVDPQWSPDGNKIAFSIENKKIGIFDLHEKSKTEISVNGNIDLVGFKLAWSPDQKNIIYLSMPKYPLIGALVKVMSGSWYERPSSLWLISLDDTKEWCLGTKNFGDIKFLLADEHTDRDHPLTLPR